MYTKYLHGGFVETRECTSGFSGFELRGGDPSAVK